MALKAMELSRQRALAVSEALRSRYKDIDASRIEAVGRGWEEPAGTGQRAEPPRRSAVVHAGVTSSRFSGRKSAPITTVSTATTIGYHSP